MITKPAKLPTAARLTRVQEILESVPEFAQASSDRSIKTTKARTDEVVAVSELAASTALLIAECGRDAVVVPKLEVVEFARRAVGLSRSGPAPQPASSVDVMDASGNQVTPQPPAPAPGLPPASTEIPDEEGKVKTGIYCLLSCALHLEAILNDAGHESRKSRISALVAEYEA